LFAAMARQPRRLVNLEPDTVAEAVTEALTVACVLDHRARLRVDLPPREAGRDGHKASQLRREHELINLPRLHGRFADRERARAV